MKRLLIVYFFTLCKAVSLCTPTWAETRYTCETGEGFEIDLIVTDTKLTTITHRAPGLPPNKADFGIVKRYSDDDGAEIIEASDGNPIKDPYSYFIRFYQGTGDLYIANDLDWDMAQEKILHHICIPNLGTDPEPHAR